MHTQEQIEELLDLVEPFIEAQEAYYNLLIESRKEVIHAFRRLRPRKTPLPTEKIEKRKRKSSKTPAINLLEPIKTKTPVKIETPISIEQLEKDSEALLDNMGI